MVLILINVLIALLTQTPQFPGQDSNEYETRTAKMIDLSQYPILQKIITEELSNVTSTDKSGFYIVRYGRFKSGILMKISKYPHEILKNHMGFVGYSIVNGHRVLFEGDDSYRFEYIRPKNAIEIKRYTNKVPMDNDEFLLNHYYILDDVYAKYSQEKGWIWSDGKPDE